MRTEEGFYTSDLNIYYDRSPNLETGERDPYYEGFFMQKFKFYQNTYKLFYAFNGEFRVTSGNYSTVIDDNFLVVSDQSAEFRFKPIKSKPFRFIFITIHPNLFKKINTESDYFRVFDNLQDKSSIILTNRNKDLKRTVDGINTLCELITNNYGRCHVEPMCLSLITDLCLTYDKVFGTIKVSTNLSVEIMHYIKKHYTEKISYDVLKEKFSVSTPTINKIVKNATNMTFYNYINDLRLVDAKNMLRKSWNLSAVKIAELCGFTSYVAFYKAYSKKYGIPPSKETKTDNVKKYYPFAEK